MNKEEDSKKQNKLKERVKQILREIKNGIIMRKIRQIKIVIISFLKAIYDVIKPKKYDDIYVSLTPIKNADEDGTYCDALKYAIDNSDIKNIAIAGIYGSGKSSVIKTFFNKLENKKYNPIYISLGDFNQDTDLYKDREYENNKAKNVFYHTLEKSILQQLLYQASEKKLPLSRFKRISKHYKSIFHIMSIVLIITVSTLVLIKFPKVLDATINNYNELNESITNYFSDKVIKLNKEYVRAVIIISLIAIYFVVYKLIFLLSRKINISKFKIKDAEIEVNNKPESIFNKYLDEIIYFFQMTEHKVVVIEDLDRYEGNALFIFQKLRELNTLINNSNQIKHDVNFIYAIKDDFFRDYEQRTKFFDYIIPIIPISSSANSNEIIWKRLEDLKNKGKVEYKFNKEFIDDVSIFIENKRLIDNIINEFIIYDKKINKAHIDDRQLFSMIMYKNKYPKDYAELQENKGHIVEIFNKKKELVQNLIKELNSEKIKLNEDKDKIKNENLNSVIELKHTLVSSIYNYDDYLGYKRHFEFNDKEITIQEFLSFNINVEKIRENTILFKIRGYGITLKETEVFKHFGNKTSFIERWENIENGRDTKLEELQIEIDKIDRQIQNIKKLSLKQLINKYDTTSIFTNIDITERFFISKGYITEEYREYTTLFVEGNLTKSDYEFICAVKIEESLPYDFKLENIDYILKRLKDEDYETISILNLDLLHHLISKNNIKKVTKIIELISREDESILQFIDDFIKKYGDEELFINTLLKKDKNFWKKIYTRLGDKEYIDKWVIRFLLNLNEEYFENTDDTFEEYISNHEDIDKYITKEQIVKVISSLEAWEIKLGNLQNINNIEFIEQIYLREIYMLNNTMIKLILTLREVDQKEFENKNLTIILTNEKLKELKEYVLYNFRQYYDYCYTLNLSDEDEESAIMEVIKNGYIELDIKQEIIYREKFAEYVIKDVDRVLIDTILDLDKLKVNYNNVLTIINEDNELKPNLIKHISSHIQEYRKKDISNNIYDRKTVEKFELMYIFNENVSLEDFKILVENFKIKIEELKECAIEKLEYLIDKKLIEFNVNNFESIKRNAKHKLVKFISSNITSFIKNIDKCNIDGFEKEILRDSSIANEDKKKIIDSIKINLNELDNEILINLISNRIIKEKEINTKVLKDISLPISKRLRLLNTILEDLKDKEEGTEYIHLFGRSYKDINSIYKATNLPYNENNKILCEILKRKRYISSYKIGRSGNLIIYNYHK